MFPDQVAAHLKLEKSAVHSDEHGRRLTIIDDGSLRPPSSFRLSSSKEKVSKCLVFLVSLCLCGD